MATFKDLTGKSFGRLTVLHRCENHGKGSAYLCSCSCGNLKEIASTSLTARLTTSCGCFRKEITSKNSRSHKLSHKHPLYDMWVGMRARCNNKKHTSYKNYGGRGIKICKEWDSFKTFISDMGERPSKRHSLDRIDNNKEYSKENCKWSTQKQQSRNMRRNFYIEYMNDKYVLAEFAEMIGINSQTIRSRWLSGDRDSKLIRNVSL